MATASNQVAVHRTGRRMMTLESAKVVAAKFREFGGLTEVRISEFGFNSGCYTVELWVVNSRAGNRNLTRVDLPPANDEEYALIRKAAIGKATERDRAALARIDANREMDRE